MPEQRRVSADSGMKVVCILDNARNDVIPLSGLDSLDSGKAKVGSRQPRQARNALCAMPFSTLSFVFHLQILQSPKLCA